MKKINIDYKYIGSKECHVGFKEIFSHLYLGKEGDIDKDLLNNIDVLVPLNSVGGYIWLDGWSFEKEIFYLPVTDYGVLPPHIEGKAITKIVDFITSGKKVAIFCLGGHGRTGYIASLVLSVLGITDPIKFLREGYCIEAVETASQITAIANFTGNKELEKYQVSAYQSFNIHDWYKSQECVVTLPKKCCNCSMYNQLIKHRNFGICDYYEKTVQGKHDACSEFE
jgi:hypothetical protein